MLPPSQRFHNIISTILRHEGGYVNHPKDPGGETKYGISKRSYPHLQIKDITKEQAKEIYYKDWWYKYNFEKYPETIGEKLFDLAVNMGHKRAIKLLQKALETDVNGIIIDGVAGRKTMAALEQRNPKDLLMGIKQQAKVYYQNLALKRPEMSVFLKGWIKRAEAL